MKFKNYIIPIGVSLAAFFWGYRGELWLGKVDPTSFSSLTAPLTPETNASPGQLNEKNSVATPIGQSTPSQSLPPTRMPFENVAPPGQPIKAKELPLSTGDDSEDYAPEDDLPEPEAGGEDDLEEDQVQTEDEPGADNSANEEVDSGANEGDLGDEDTADTAEAKPVKP